VFDIVRGRCFFFAMIDAEELGGPQKNVDDMAKSDKPELKRAFGTDGNLGEQLGLPRTGCRARQGVGKFTAKAFDRNVGAGSKLGIARGSPALNKGVIQ